MKAFFFILNMFYILSLSAQDISVELSVEWDKDLDFDFRELDSIDIKPASLVLTYRNLSDKPLYFYKRSGGGRSGMPVITIGSLTNYVGIPSAYDLFITYSNYTGENFYVNMEPGIWIVEDSMGYSASTVNDQLYRIYDYIDQEYVKWEKHNLLSETYLIISDFSNDSIQPEAKNKFVYLKEKEIHRDTFNLIGFQLIGGDFTFRLNTNKSLTKVRLGIEFEENKKYSQVYQNLPEQVDGYDLYKGKFLTNEVTVSFPGIRLPAQKEKLKKDDEE